MKTIQDLRSYVRGQATRDWRDYGSHYYWHQDALTIRRQRERVMRAFPARIRSDEPLIPGNYGRLTIEDDGTPCYCPGQYAPTEIWCWVYEYLTRTN